MISSGLSERLLQTVIVTLGDFDDTNIETYGRKNQARYKGLASGDRASAWRRMANTSIGPAAENELRERTRTFGTEMAVQREQHLTFNGRRGFKLFKTINRSTPFE